MIYMKTIRLQPFKYEKSVEKNHKSTFGIPSEELKKGFEFQLFDLTNAARVVQGLSILILR